MIKKIIQRTCFGIFSGTFIGLCFSLFFSYFYQSTTLLPAPPRFMHHFASSLNAFATSIILWSLIGIVFSVSSLIFSETDWSITKMTITHFIICYSLFLPLAILSGWFPINLPSFISFTVTYIIIYCLIWTIFMYSAKKEIQHLNAVIKS